MKDLQIAEIITLIKIVPTMVVLFYSIRFKNFHTGLIGVFYFCTLFFGANLLKWKYSQAVFSTPLAFMISWYIVKTIKRR